jgi:hypothetical protein
VTATVAASSGRCLQLRFSGDPGAGSGVHITETAHPGQIEAFRRGDGIFNYYKEIDGAMSFFESPDFAAAPAAGLTNTRGAELPSWWWSQHEGARVADPLGTEDNIAGADTPEDAPATYTLQAKCRST